MTGDHIVVNPESCFGKGDGHCELGLGECMCVVCALVSVYVPAVKGQPVAIGVTLCVDMCVLYAHVCLSPPGNAASSCAP